MFNEICIIFTNINLWFLDSFGEIGVATNSQSNEEQNDRNNGQSTMQ